MAYLDIDEAVAGQDALSPRLHPLLSRMLFDSAREYTQPDPQQRPATFPPPGSKVLDWMLFRAREQKLLEKSETNQDVPMYAYELAFTSSCESTVLYFTYLFVHYSNKVSSHKFIPFISYN